MSKKAKFLTLVSMFAFMVAIVAPTGAHAATTITIKNNGADSTNKVKIKKYNKKYKKANKQKNKTRVKNGVVVLQNTGLNSADKNTTKGGEVSVDSGNANASVVNKVTTAGNEATVDECGCEEDNDLKITILDNGADSTNKVKVSYGSGGTGSGVNQTNYASIINGVFVAQNTGGNSADKNTGGAVDVNSGDAEATVKNVTTLGGNTIN